VKRRVAIFCIRAACVLGLGLLALGAYYAFTRPDHADPGTGRIYRVGRILNATYLTRDELRWLCILGGGAVPFLIAGAALGWPFSNADYEKARATYVRDKGGDDRA
jgi:hypothetical protein